MLERATGIEPAVLGWKPNALPLGDARERVAGFCCQAPAGLRLGRFRDVRQVLIVVHVYKMRTGYRALGLSRSNSPPSRTHGVVRCRQLRYLVDGVRTPTRVFVVEAAGFAPASIARTKFIYHFTGSTQSRAFTASNHTSRHPVGGASPRARLQPRCVAT